MSGKEKLTDIMTWEEILEKVKRESNMKKKGFNEWFMKKKELNGYFFNSNTYALCFNIQQSIMNDDRDHFMVVAGTEGNGKSTLAIQLASVISPNFKLKNICFEPKQLIDGIRNAKKGDCFVLDEGNLFLFSREAITGNNRFMVKLFALMRQMNLCLIICVPNFFTLDSYVRDHRVNSLFYIHTKSKYKCYSKKAIRLISHWGRVTKDIGTAKIPYGSFFEGYHNKFLPKLNDIDDVTYRKYKSENFEIFLDELQQFFNDIDKKSKLISRTEATNIINMDERTLMKLVDDGKLKAKKLGGKWMFDRENVENLLDIV